MNTNTENQPEDKKPDSEANAVGCSNLLALSCIREIVGDANHMLTNEELIEDIKANYIKPVKRCEIPQHLRGKQLAKKTIRERDNVNLANMLSSTEKRTAQLADLLTSARAIAERKGEDTAWDRFAARLEEEGIGQVTPRTFRILPSDICAS